LNEIQQLLQADRVINSIKRILNQILEVEKRDMLDDDEKLAKKYCFLLLNKIISCKIL
jgi:hypothetical protein